MQSASIDYVLIPPGPNFFYLTGMLTESMERLALFIVGNDFQEIVCPDLMKQQVQQETPVDTVTPWSDGENPYSLLKSRITRTGNVAIDGSLPFFHFEKIEEFLKGRTRSADPLLERMRIIKDQDELSRIREAVSRSEKSLESSLSELRDGITEIEFSRYLENSFIENGLSGPAFPSIVSFGPNSAMPHHSPDRTALKSGDTIVIDYGGAFEGYASDSTRTFFWKNVAPEMQPVFEAVKNANETVRREANKKTRYNEMDGIARSVISKSGYGDKFIHRLGHGLGIQVHEPPYLVASNSQTMINNSVFTIEPGIYIPGLGGVRIEDTNFFDGQRCISFNRMSRSLKVL